MVISFRWPVSFLVIAFLEPANDTVFFFYYCLVDIEIEQKPGAYHMHQWLIYADLAPRYH